MNLTETTIAAIATAPGNAGVAVIRLSGPQSWALIQPLFVTGPQKQAPHTLKPGRFYHGWIHDPKAASKSTPLALVDEVLILVFQAPNSFTGEDVIEIHCHGGQVLTQHILNLCLVAGASPAQPGEYSLRAFLNGKVDLTQAESIMDLVSTQSSRMVKMAAENLGQRSLGNYIERMITALLNIQAQIVASVDFPDEVDEPDRMPLIQSLSELQTQAESLKITSQRHRFIRDGLKIALLGLPNSGKSSLFNALLASERAIVTDIAGTTRDLITETLWIEGVALTLVDTAGIHESAHQVEQMGIKRSWQAAQEADCVLYVLDIQQGIQAEDTVILNKLPPNLPILKLANKTDLAKEQAVTTLPDGFLPLSAKTSEGIPEIFQWLGALILTNSGDADNTLAVSLNQRQQSCLDAVLVTLNEAKQALTNPHLPIDIATVPLTASMRKLDELLGRDTTEEMLTQVFSQFCVGK